MNYSNYKRGYSALRAIINNDELEFCRQFAAFQFQLNDNRWSERRLLRGIYNAKTNNIVAFVNNKGNVFIRPNSIYAEHLIKGSKNKVIKNNNLRNYRNKVGSHIKNKALINLFAENAVDKLIANKDKPNNVFIGKAGDGINFDIRFFNNVLTKNLDKDKFKNTLYALKESALQVEKRPEDADTGRHSVYLKIEDKSEVIAQEEKIERIKREIEQAYVSNIREIARDAILSNHSMNPLQFTYKTGDETYTGRIMLNRVDMSFTEHTPISDWIRPGDLLRYINFEEPVHSLAERGIDEMQQRNERDERQAMMDRMVNYSYEQYARAGATIRVPRMENVEWAVSESPFGQSLASVYYDEVASTEAIQAMPQIEVPDNFWGDPDESTTPMTSA